MDQANKMSNYLCTTYISILLSSPLPADTVAIDSPVI